MAISTMSTFWRSVVVSYNPLAIEFFGTLIVQLCFFWIPSTAYLLLDYAAPSFSHRHKIQPIPKQPTGQEIRQCALVVLRNQVMSMVIHLLLLYLSANSQPYRVDEALPSLLEVVRDISLCLIMREALFYHSHRLLHSAYLYPRVHKQHHKFIAPVALAAQYAHPIEHIFANVLPITLPPQILKCHVLTYWLFVAFELFETATVHSGYDFLAGAAKMHDLHHEKFMVNFGALGLFDRLYGTDKLRKKNAN